MKSQNLTKKLYLNKRTIVTLDIETLKVVKGGIPTNDNTCGDGCNTNYTCAQSDCGSCASLFVC